MAATPYVIRDGDVWNVGLSGTDLPGRHVCRGSERMALAFVPEDDVAYKHGESTAIRAWVERQRLAGIAMEMLEFPVAPAPVALLNDCLHGLGGPSTLVGRFVALDAEDPTLASIPRYPA